MFSFSAFFMTFVLLIRPQKRVQQPTRGGDNNKRDRGGTGCVGRSCELHSAKGRLQIQGAYSDSIRGPLRNVSVLKIIEYWRNFVARCYESSLDSTIVSIITHFCKKSLHIPHIIHYFVWYFVHILYLPHLQSCN